MVKLFDSLTLDKDARICADGSLVAEVFAARTGIQVYGGREVDPSNERGLFDKQAVNIYRPEDEVFKRDSLATFAAAPVTVNHPSQAVTADNWKDLGVGEINGDVVRDGDKVRVPLIVRDSAAVLAARTTHKQLSMGYTCDLDFTAGIAPDGTAYDAIQRNIRINHIALVPAGRAGPDIRITDYSPLENKVSKITFDGLPLDLSDAEAVTAVIGKLQNQIKDAAEASTATISKLTGENAALIAKLADAEKAASVEAIDEAVSARQKLVDQAKAVDAKIVTDGLSNADIQRAIVNSKLGDVAKDMDDAAIGGAFQVIAANVKQSDEKVVPIGGVKPAVDTAQIRDAAKFARYA